jgi:hypothetical protein
VAALLAGQLGRDEAWAAAEADAFRALAQRYTVAGASPGV